MSLGLLKFPRLTIALFLLAVLLCPTLRAQKDTGNIVGTIRDASGAVVTGAQVTVRDVDRGSSITASSNDAGEYFAGPLRIGHYTVSVEKEGFKTAVVGPVELKVQDRLVVDVTLQVGATTEKMIVNATAVQLETETSDLGQVVDSRRVSTLPLNGRNYAQLALLGAGVAPSEPGSRVSASYGFSANGARALQNNFLLDGIDNNANLGDVLNESAFVIQPSVDAIAEFKVQTNSYSAEFGRGNGAILNAVIKSGTNGFHGDMYEFLRNEVVDAANSTVKQQGFGREPYKQNQFGVTFGGPIIKSRTFFFADYEGLRTREGLILNGTIPTQNMVNGDFSSMLAGTSVFAADANGNATGQIARDCNGNPTFVGELFDARLTQASNLNPNGFCGVPIGVDGTGNPTNKFQSAQNPSGTVPIDSLAARLAALYPSPNSSNPNFNYLALPVAQTTRNNFDVRVDHKFSEQDYSFVRFSYEDQPRFIPPPFGNALDGGDFFSGKEDNSYRSVAISETHVFNPGLVNEFRLGYNRINAHRFQINYNVNVSGPGQLNFPGVPFVPDNGGLPNITFGDGSSVGIGSSGFLPSIEKQNSWVFTDNLTKIAGKHALKIGGEVRIEQFTIFQPSASRGAMSFGTEFTSNPAAPIEFTVANDSTSGGPGGNGFATFLLGIPDGGSITNLHNIDYRRQIYAVYVQDDWKVSGRLTLNLGLRYEVFSTIKEHHNEQANFDFATQSLIVPRGTNATLTPTLASEIPISATGTPGLVQPDLNNFAPRVGLAYKITDKLVLRSGYGIFYGGQENGPFSNPSPGFNPPFFVTQSFIMPCGLGIANPALGPNDCAIPTLNTLSNGFPANALVDPITPILYSIVPGIRTPYNQQWHLGFQYQLPGETILDISYAGSRGLKLFTFYNGNQAVPATAPQFATLCNDLTAGITPANCPTAPRRPAKICDTANPPNCNPVFDTSIALFRADGFSNYHSLQARLEKQFSHGLQFEASYTFSHALDNASSASLGSANQGDFRLQTQPRAEYGNADFDVRHRFVFSSIYELPFGKGKAFGNSASGLTNQLIGGWQVAGIITASTGNWFTPTDISSNLSTSDCGGTVFNCIRPDRIGNPNAKPCVSGTVFNTCAFTSASTLGSFGNAGRNIIQGPGFQNWDVSLFKTFPIREERRIEFRAEFFNAWNHANPEFTNPDTVAENRGTELGSAAYGFTGFTRPPRRIQFALKFYF
ncbi:MAG TPA: TonB-dependent receptor [Candidatus Angelobacter sp.]|nr:TonB-dependent receptor [Candidatus Angelobacter sp.]